MRLLHISDIHVGVETYGRPASQADLEALPDRFAPGVDRTEYLGVNTRLLDFLAAMDYAVDYAIEGGVDLVLFAGDAYKARNPTQTHQREFARRIARLSAAGIPTFLTIGNHDLPHVANRATALEIFPTLSVANVSVGQRLETHRIATNAGDVQVVALPWIRIGQFMSREETRGKTLDQIKQEVETGLVTYLQEEVDKLDPAVPAVLCAHVNIAGAKTASEQSMMLGNDHVLSLGTVAIPQFDYVALGNIHKHQVLTEHPPVVYAGSIERVDFSEEREDKGFVVADIDPARPQGERLIGYEFVPTPARPMLTIRVSTHPMENPTEAAVQAIAAHPEEELARSIVRLRVDMRAEQEPAFREADVRAALAPAFFVAGIERRVERERRTRLPWEDAERIEPLDALRRYFQSKGTADDRERTLLRYAEDLLHEELAEQEG